MGSRRRRMQRRCCTAWSASWRTAGPYRMSLSNPVCLQCVRGSTTTSNASYATPNPSMTSPSWLCALRHRQPHHLQPSLRRGAAGALGLAHNHLDAPVTRFCLLVWRGDQRLPFPAPNGTDKARVQTIFDQNVAYSFGSLDGQTVIICHFPDAIRMPCNLHLDRLALCHLGQQGVQDGTRVWRNFGALLQEIEGKAERFGGLRGQRLCEGPLDVFRAERVLLDVAFRIDFCRSKGGIEEGSALRLCDGHSANLPILSGEQHD